MNYESIRRRTRRVTVGGVPLGSGAPVAIPDFTHGRWMQKETRPGDMYSLDKVYPEAFED